MQEIDVGQLHASVQPIVKRALQKGWSARCRPTRTSTASVELHAPAPHIHVTVIVPPLRQWNDRALRTLEGKLVRYGR